MMKNILAGVALGVANIIPGVSGGTILVLLGMFNQLTNSISNIFKRHGNNRQKDIIFLIEIAIGVAVGLIGFANIIDFLFSKWPTQTIFAFAGLISLSIPSIIKNEMNSKKILPLYFFIGLFFIITLMYLNPGDKDFVVTVFPSITIIYLLQMVILGSIAGATMIMPGISGSMVLLIIGSYHIVKTYVAKALTFDIEIIIPLLFLAIGIGIGIIISSKVTSWLLKTYHNQTMSLIIGLVLASGIMLIPTNINYNFELIITCSISFMAGGSIVMIFEKIKNNKRTD